MQITLHDPYVYIYNQNMLYYSDGILTLQRFTSSLAYLCQVGMTREPWAADEYLKWEKLAKEVLEYQDVLIRPDLDNRSERIF